MMRPVRGAATALIMSGLDPEAFVRDVLTRIGEYPMTPSPWNIGKPVVRSAAA